MSDKEEEKGAATAATATATAAAEAEAEAEEENTSTETMAETEEKPQQKEPEITKKFEKMNISLSIWPPTQRTRDAVIKRLIDTLSTPSILSKRYGSLSAEESSSAAKIIEEEAFAIATSASSSSSSSTDAAAEDDGIEILQIYSKEISKRMLEVVKSKSTTDSASSQIPTSAETSEEISSIEPGSS